MEPILSMLTNQLVCYQQIFVEYIPCAHHRRDCQILYYWFPRWHSSKESACQCRRCRFNPWVGKSTRGGNGNPLQSSCLGSPVDRGVRWATVHGITKSRTRLSNQTTTEVKIANFTLYQNLYLMLNLLGENKNSDSLSGKWGSSL